jgi:hypothetical protein
VARLVEKATTRPAAVPATAVHEFARLMGTPLISTINPLESPRPGS